MVENTAGDRKTMTPPRFDFGIVIPVLESSKFLPYCLQSCVFQEGTYSLHIVVVDKSGADTVATLSNAIAALAPNPALIKVTYLKSNDSGAAEGINRGMSLLESRMMTWLGSDDLLFPGSLSTLGAFLQSFPGREWVTGRGITMNATGLLIVSQHAKELVRPATGYPNKALSLGLHASHMNLPFIQQEGTFWSNSLWEKSGGALDENLQLAFDFELWTRMARFAELTQLNVPLGIFRHREKQLSSDRGGYFREVEAVRGNIKLGQRQTRFPFTATGDVAVSDSRGNWRIQPVHFRFFSRERASPPWGGFILQRKILSLLTRLMKINRRVRFVLALVRKKNFTGAKQRPF